MRNLLFLLLLCLVLSQIYCWRRRRRRCHVAHCSVTGWTPWLACTHPCGPNGLSIRKRQVARGPSCGGSGCPHLSENRPCNRECGQGILQDKACKCNSGWTGQCCHTGEKNFT